jgi:hypothetical protein
MDALFLRNLTYVKCLTIIEHEEVDTDFEGKTRIQKQDCLEDKLTNNYIGSRSTWDNLETVVCL